MVDAKVMSWLVCKRAWGVIILHKNTHKGPIARGIPSVKLIATPTSEMVTSRFQCRHPHVE